MLHILPTHGDDKTGELGVVATDVLWLDLLNPTSAEVTNVEEAVGGRLPSLGLVRELSLQGEGFWADGIVPFAVEVVAGEVDDIHFGVGHLDGGRIGVLIEFATNRQTGLRRGCGDQLDDDLMADERFAAPVAGDEREEAMLDLVPLAGARRQVTHGDGHAEFVSQFLQLDLP